MYAATGKYLFCREYTSVAAAFKTVVRSPWHHRYHLEILTPVYNTQFLRVYEVFLGVVGELQRNNPL